MNPTLLNSIPPPSEPANELHAMMSQELRMKLAAYEVAVTVPKGASLIRRGVRPDNLVILNSGAAEIKFAGGRESFSLSSQVAGKVFGMRSVVSGELPEFDVTCTEPCNVTLMPSDAFLALLKANPEIYFAVAKVLSVDLQIANRMLRNCSRHRWQGNRSQSRKISLM